jgi:hypothetical protein
LTAASSSAMWDSLNPMWAWVIVPVESIR